MITAVKGDLLQAKTQALVNTVNTVGVMGKGIALQFKESFPYNNKVYRDACKRNELAPGKLLGVWDENLLLGRKYIINFPTKTHWRQPSRYEYIETGLVALKELLQQQDIQSVAIPPLGCGNGGLDWSIVKSMIGRHLGDLPIEILVFEPNEHIKAVLQQQVTQKKVKLTPARAQLLYALFAFESMGEYSSLFAANKLAYFLQRLGEDLRLQFKPHYYGPYALGVEKVLYHLNGVYLKGMEQHQIKPFEPLQLNYEKYEEVEEYVNHQLNAEQQKRVQNLFRLVGNYCSELSLEILATTDFIMQDHPDYSLDEVLHAISGWSDRKDRLFERHHVETAYRHLRKQRDLITPTTLP